MRPRTAVPISSTLTRRSLVQAGGALFVSLALPAQQPDRPAAAVSALDPTRLPSWLEIRADNTIVARTGRTETGTG